MHHVAQQPETPAPSLEYGTVAGMIENRFVVSVPHGDVTAWQALGCVIRPAVGDRVLLSLDEAGECWILSVLSRPEGERATEVVLPGRVSVHAAGGDLSLTSPGDVVLGAGRRLDMASDAVSLAARKADVQVEKMNFLGRVVSAQVKKFRCVGKSMETVFHRLTQRLTDCFRFVAEHDEVQAGSSRQLVEETLTVHTKNEFHVAEELVKLDADQVHLG